jgi:hypothetical protein
VIDSAALPPLISTGLLIWFAPSKNTMSPVIVPAVAEVTVAVNVTFWPTLEGFSDETTAVEVAALTV